MKFLLHISLLLIISTSIAAIQSAQPSQQVFAAERERLAANKAISPMSDEDSDTDENDVDYSRRMQEVRELMDKLVEEDIQKYEGNSPTKNR